MKEQSPKPRTRATTAVMVALPLGLVLIALYVGRYLNSNSPTHRERTGSGPRQALDGAAKEQDSFSSKPIENKRRSTAPLADRILQRKPAIRAAVDRLFQTWDRTGYRAKHAAQLGGSITQRAVGTSGVFFEASDSPSEFEQAVWMFNNEIWADDASYLALADLLGEEIDPEKRTVAAEYTNLADFKGGDLLGTLKEVLSRDGANGLVARLKAPANDQVGLVLITALGAQLQITQRLPRTIGWQDRLPLDDGSAEELAQWYLEHRGTLQFRMRLDAQAAVAYCGRCSQKLLDLYTQEAFGADAQTRVPFAKALCQSADTRDEGIPGALRLLSDKDFGIQWTAIETLSRIPRISDGTSACSSDVCNAFIAIAQGNSDPRIRQQALGALALFDRSDAFEFVQRAFSSEDRQFAGIASSVAEQLRLEESAGYRTIRQQLFDKYSSVAHDSSASAERRSAGFWVMYRTIYRRAMESDSNAASDYRALISEMQGSSIPTIQQRAKEIQQEVQAIGGKVGLQP